MAFFIQSNCTVSASTLIIYEMNIKRNISVLAFIYVFQMTTVKRSCCWGGDGNESSSRTETAHYLQNRAHTGVSEDWFQQHQRTGNYIVVV